MAGDRDITGPPPFSAVARRGALALVAGLALVATAGVASAHAVRADEFAAPVPLRFVYAGAGVTVAATAAWLAVGDRTAPGDDADTGRRQVADLSPTVTHALALGGRVLVLALFVAALVHGVVGRRVPAENLATVVVWPLLLKGLGVVAVLAGSPWRTVSPWETLYDLLCAIEGRAIGPYEYPDRLAAWPAVAGFVLGVGVLENLTLVTRAPRLTVAVAAGYALAMLAGGLAVGRGWFARADALAVLFDLLGRVSPLAVERTDDGGATVAVRPPWRGATASLADTSLVAFVVAALYTVLFDGFTATRFYRRLLADARDVAGVAVGGVALYLAGLVAFLASYLLAAALVERLGARPDGKTDDGGEPLAAARAFGGTLVPIAAAYEVAHNSPFVAANVGQAVAVGRDLAGAGSGSVALLSWLPVPWFWASQVALVVAGHVVAVVAAHRVATGRYATPAAARRGHAPLVVAMVGYTLVSLWIVSQPLAT